MLSLQQQQKGAFDVPFCSLILSLLKMLVSPSLVLHATFVSPVDAKHSVLVPSIVFCNDDADGTIPVLLLVQIHAQKVGFFAFAI